MKRITLTLATRTDGITDRDSYFDEDKMSFGPDGRVFVRVVDIVRVMERKGRCEVYLEGTSSYSSYFHVIDKYDDIIAQINSAEG
jgi:hypothetical protein